MEEIAPPRRLIVTVHGIRTFGHWQERLEALVREREPDACVRHYKYGYFSCLAFLVPPLRWLVTRRFRHALVASCRDDAWTRVDVVAHSFGTHLVAWALHGLPRAERPRLHTLVLAGSVLKPSFPWQELTDGCVGRVVNDCGTRDAILVLNQGLVLFTGMAGRVGFAGMDHERFRNRFFAHGHSDYFLRDGREDDGFMRAWWLPLLRGDEPVAVPPDPRDASSLNGLFTFALNNAEPVKVALFALPLALLALLFFQLYREAETRRREASGRLSELLVANAQRRGEEGDLASALLWYAEALRVAEPDDEDAARDERVRFATALAQLPMLEHMRFPDEWRTLRTAFDPDGSRLALAGGYPEFGVRIWDLEADVLSPPLRHENAIASVAWSPDGTRVATASNDLTARVWDARSGAPLTPPLQHDAQVTLVAFAPDGERLLTVGRRGDDGIRRARVWDVRAAEVVGAPLLHSSDVADACFGADGRLVATIAEDGTTRVWDASSGEPVPVLATSDRYRGTKRVRFDSGGTRLVTSDGSALRVWDVASGRPLSAEWPLESCVLVEFLGEDAVLAVDADGATALFSVRADGRIAGPHAHGGAQASALSLATPPGRRPLLALASYDGTARVWDARSDHPVTPRLRHGRGVERAELSRDGRRLATVDNDGVVRVWRLGSAALVLGDVGPFAPSVWQASFAPDGRRILSVAREPNAVCSWDAETGELAAELALDAEPELACFSPDGRLVLVAGRDGNATLFDATTLAPVGAPLPHGAPIRCASFSRDGTRLVTGGEDGGARVWSVADGSALCEPIAHASPVAVEFVPDGSAVLVAGGAAAWTYALPSGEPWRRDRHDESGLLAAALAPDGLRVATGGMGGVVRVWDARSGAPLTPELVHAAGTQNITLPHRVWHVVFAPDGSRLASSSADGTTRVWDARTGMAAAPPLAKAELFAAFSPDGRWIATAGWQGIARVWNARTGAAITPPLEHADATTHVAFAPDGTRLATASLDGTVRVWSLAPDPRESDELRALAELLACARVDETGGALELSTDELRARWVALRGARPAPERDVIR